MFEGIYLSLLSIAMKTKGPINALILTGDFTDIKDNYKPFKEEMALEIEKAIRKYDKASSVRIHEFKDNVLDEIKKSKNIKGRFSPYSMLRLFLDDVEDVPDRLLYLDGDTMANNDITPLYEYDLEDNYLGMAKDATGSIWLVPDYCNSGVILMDYAKIRKTNLFLLCREMIMDRKLWMPDQSAINLYFQGKIAVLPNEFNEQRKTHKDTVIRHFCNVMHLLPILHVAKVKQWEIDKVHDILKDHHFDDVYEEYESLKNVAKE